MISAVLVEDQEVPMSLPSLEKQAEGVSLVRMEPNSTVHEARFSKSGATH